MVHITDTRTQKVVSYTSAHITEAVLVHDPHWEEHSSLSFVGLWVLHLMRYCGSCTWWDIVGLALDEMCFVSVGHLKLVLIVIAEFGREW